MGLEIKLQGTVFDTDYEMQFLKRFCIFMQRGLHLKYSEIISIDKNSQAPSWKPRPRSAWPIGGQIDHADLT